MSRHTLRQLGRLAWADRHSEGPYDDNFMWASWGTYRRLFWNLWWFSPSGPAGNAGVAASAKTVDEARNGDTK